MSSDAELDAKLTALLRVMVSRLPSNKTLPTAVAQQLLRGKYGDTYPEAYVAGRADFITETLARLTAEKEKAATAAATPAAAATKPAQDSSDDEDDSDDDDSDSGDDSGDDDDDDDSDESSPSEWDEEASASDDEEDDDDDNDDDDGSDGGLLGMGDRRQAVGPERKKPRTEEAESGGTGSVAERCKAMAECLRKLSYRVRAPAETESLDEYLHNFLIAKFTKHGMNPAKYGKSDLKRYRIKREVELLQQDGATLNLDRRNRAGRGFAHVAISKEGGGSSQTSGAAPTAPARQASMFLDDE